jgi:hypothetical protein
VLPLANSPGGHRLGVNGLAVDSTQSILCVVLDRVGLESEADKGIDILEDEMALYAPGI